MATDQADQSITLAEAAELFGVSVKTLRRRISDGKLPEADKVDTDHGPTWVIPSTTIRAVGDRFGWTSNTVQDTGQGDVWERLVVLAEARANEAAAAAAEQVRAAKVDAEREKRRAEQAVSDLESERAELVRTRAQLAETKGRLTATKELVARADADTERERQRAQEATEQVDQLAAELQHATASMGWWTRRRWRKANPS